MDITNELLKFVGCEYLATSKIVESGQRVVYLASNNNDPSAKFVLKTCPVYPSNVARIQRELKILSEIDSKYFPKPLHSQFITDEDLNYFVDNFDPKTQGEKINEVLSFNLRPFFVTVEEYIEHIPINDYIVRLKNEDTLIQYLLNVFEALNLLWEKKIVHRDLKPDNILVRSDLSPVVIDLGIAKSMRDGTQVITSPFSSSPCTPQFASPEQLFNSKTEVTYKSDQFSIGILSYFILTGEFPFGTIQDIGIEDYMKSLVANNIKKINDLNSNLSESLQTFVHKLLSPQPYKRFRNYQEIKNKLEEMRG